MLAQRADTWPLAEIGLQLIQFGDDRVGRYLRMHAPPLNQRNAGPACSRNDVDCRVNNAAKGCGLVRLGLQLDRQRPQYFGQFAGC